MSQPQVRENRWLAAIVFIDMVDYSAKMQVSESAAQAAVDALWGAARPLIAEHDGVEIRTFGDGMLSIFPGTLTATQCCLKIFEALAELNRQRKYDEPIRARASVHLGEVTDTGGDIYGDGVNIAARLVDLAPAGGIAISPHVRDHIANAIDHPIKSLGPKVLKNIKAPLEVFCLPGPDCMPADIAAAAAAGESPMRRWTFGAASFEEGTRELSVAGQAPPLSREAAEILLCLLRHAGEIVTPKELCEVAGLACLERSGHCDVPAAACDQSIAPLMQELHTALRDPEHQQITTQPGYGYRLAARVSVEAAPSTSLTQFDFKSGDHPPLRPNWSLIEMVGQGGQGEVWRGRHDKTGETRIYKFALDPAKLGTLKREITLSRVLHATVHNENFIRVLDWNLERPPFFIECEDGGKENLIEWAQSQGGIAALPLPARLGLFAQIADALAAAHSVGVLHKDLKPANILISQPDGEHPLIRITDFGSGGVLDARYLDDAGVTRMGFTQSEVSGDSSSGTPMYLAPEIIAGQIATVQSDVFALGIMLYQIAIGNLGQPLATGWEAHVADELLREDIAAATQGNPVHRVADASQLAERVRDLDARRAQRAQQRADQERTQLAELDAERTRRQLKRISVRRRWSIAVMGALVLGLLLAVQQQHLAEAAEARATQAAREARAVADFLTGDLFKLVGEQPLSTLTVPELLLLAADRLEGHDDQLPAVSAQLHLALGNALYNTEQLAAAESQYDAALRAFEAAGETATPQAVVAAARSLAAKQGKLGELEALLPRYEQLLEDARATLGADQREVLELRRWLAQSHYGTGHWARALTELQATVAALDAAGTVDRSAQRARIRLAEILMSVGRFTEADQLLVHTLASNARVDDPLIENTAQGFRVRALVEMEDFDSARQALDRARQLTDEWRLPGMTMVRASMALFEGFLALRSGEPERAIELLKPTLSAIQHYAPVDLEDAAMSEYWGWLALAYCDAGRTAAGEDVARTALESETRLPGADDNARAQMARITLAEVLVMAGKDAEASAALGLVKPDTVNRLGNTTPLYARWRRLQGLLALARGAREPAAEHLREALAAFEASYGPQHAFGRRGRTELAQATGT